MPGGPLGFPSPRNPADGWNPCTRAPPLEEARFGSKLLLSLFTLSLSACGAGTEAEIPPETPRAEVQPGTEEGSSDSLLLTARVRLMAANISSGNYQSYDPGHGTRIFQGTKPDVVMIQEFNYGDNSATAIRSFVNTAFGSSFYYYREAGAQIPNGVISRWPIVASGEWDDTQVSNRDFAWARIDIPGPKDLWVVSVHLLTTSSSVRNTEANNLVQLHQGATCPRATTWPSAVTSTPAAAPRPASPPSPRW